MTGENVSPNDYYRPPLPFAADARYEESALGEIREALRFPPLLAGGMTDGTHCEAAVADRYQAYRVPLRFRVAGQSNTCESYAVSPGMVMSVIDVGCAESLACRLFGQDMLEFHFRVSGSLLLAGDWGEVCVREPACLLWYQPAGCDDTAVHFGMAQEVRESWVSLCCDRTWLLRTGGPSAAALLDNLTGGDARFPAPQFRTSALGEMASVLEEILSLARQAEPDWLITIAKAHELLSVVLRNAQFLQVNESPAPLIPVRDQRRIALARDILLKEFVAPPKLRDLARRVGINSSRLCAGFKLLFSETTSSFVRRQRLELALKLLTTSDLQVREVARKIGYRHHGTFTAAFARHFGMAPKVARRSRP
jgi:AraC-like DNA-binding protein